MTKNRIYEHADNLKVAVTQPATPSSGDPVLYGQRPGVALTDEGTDGETSVRFKGAFELEAEAVDGVGNSAIAEGDILYYDSAAAIKINKDDTNGVRYGYAGPGGALVAGASGNITVILGF
ncbi:MAG: DUF2190 family protein [Chloroflexi bacterium]|nr:MAG: DUF2190 family protein [Chloroflexota bacterium]MBL1196906.1 DUF2190 family protein [Chloroflexota bacterium]NOH14202.1 DUF2190 family protein [Chloroflexota bacterium]